MIGEIIWSETVGLDKNVKDSASKAEASTSKMFREKSGKFLH